MQQFKYRSRLNSGLFRNRITFLQSTSTEDELGQKEIVWAHYTNAWAMIKTVKGSEYVAAASDQAELTYRFIIHYIPGISKNMRIDFNGRIFDIIEPPINDDELDETVTILARENL
ncbi:phage head closure protein [Cytobacillus oceanisediminis]|uniref:phage head closure protein n=1 Tax=Cytobacillus oceanisediminis TaxID=665099 RepID=UPI002079E1B9|nr:phage head closure protein [Cytobacillus oceanisediminis]USK46345.1 phage head closure protein [Cytobacillus oceanisediminis]